MQRLNLRSWAAAVSGTDDRKRSRAAGEAATVVRTVINSDVKTIEARIVAVINTHTRDNDNFDLNFGKAICCRQRARLCLFDR